MLPTIALILAAVAVLLLAARLFVAAPPRKVARVVAVLGLGGLVVLGLWLLLTGKLAGLLAVAAGLSPWVGRALRLHSLWRMFRRRQSPPGQSPPRPASGPMTREEAFEVLGLRPGATPDQIRAAHRRLMRAVHPDHGGTDWLAARLNQARDLLLTDIS